MLWKNEQGAKALVAAACAMMLGGTALAAPLVVRSSGPSAKIYPAGKPLTPDAKITLKSGDSVVLLDSRGTRTLSGPGNFSANGASLANGGTGSTLAALASGSGERRARIGAVRSGSGIDPNSGSSPNLWYVDVTRSTNMCIAEPTSITLWRPDSDAGATIDITGPGGASGRVQLAPGEATASWPANLPVSDGGVYKIRRTGANAPSTVKFLIVDRASAGLEELAQSLIKSGCNAQIDVLIETTSLPAGHSAS